MRNTPEYKEFFYPDEEHEDHEPTLWERVRRVLLQLGALLAVLGMLYLSGIYQATFFRQTPADTIIREFEAKIEEEEIVLPLHIFVVGGEGTLASNRNTEDVVQIVENASAVWNQARIELDIAEINYIEQTDEQTQELLNNPSPVIPTIPEYKEDAINVFFTRTLYGINGIAYAGGEVVAIADFTTSGDFRTLAHEIGHVLRLPHVSDRNRLMASGGNGFELTLEEIELARVVAETLVDN